LIHVADVGDSSCSPSSSGSSVGDSSPGPLPFSAASSALSRAFPASYFCPESHSDSSSSKETSSFSPGTIGPVRDSAGEV